MTDKAVLTNMSVEEMEGLFEKIPSGDTVRVEIVRILYRKHANSISLVYSEMDKFKLLGQFIQSLSSFLRYACEGTIEREYIDGIYTSLDSELVMLRAKIDERKRKEFRQKTISQ